MVKVELKDAHFLQLSSALKAGYASHFMLAPHKAQDYYLTTLEPKSDTMARWFGAALAYGALHDLVSSRADSTIRKDMLKAGGAIWGASAVQSIYNVRKKHQKEDRGWGSAALKAGMAGLLLWRAFEKGDKPT